MLAALVALVLAAPVGGPVARGFDLGADPFAAGRHRGVDFAARPGDVVRAPCRGRVVFAGRVEVGVATLRCAGWRVTVLPLASISVRAGAAVVPRTRLGTLGSSAAHAGLHLGVRRDGAPFGYVDPLRFLVSPRPSAPVLVGPRTPRPRAPRAAAPPAATVSSPPVAFVPWPAWAGLALLLAAVPVRVRLRRRWELRRRTSTAAG